jgi:DNA invertase Pin-like site-specific DNA recombinase
MIRMEPELENKVIELAKSGNRPKKISQETGLPEHYVRKIVSRNKIKIVPLTNSSTIDIYKIISDLITGMNISDIARKYDTTRQYIYLIKKRCKAAGIPITSREKNID